jgi:hypothetical protein
MHWSMKIQQQTLVQKRDMAKVRRTQGLGEWDWIHLALFFFYYKINLQRS